jgi:3-oxoadipate enol-lactonase
VLTGASVYWESGSWLRREDVAPRLPEIAVPTLVIHGEEDGILPMSGAEEMAARVQRGRLARIAGAGHTANAEQPEAVNDALRSFLDEVYGGA